MPRSRKNDISLAINSAKGIFSATKKQTKRSQMKGCLNQKFQLHSCDKCGTMLTDSLSAQMSPGIIHYTLYII